jgi:hypothetical protein
MSDVQTVIPIARHTEERRQEILCASPETQQAEELNALITPLMEESVKAGRDCLNFTEQPGIRTTRCDQAQAECAVNKGQGNGRKPTVLGPPAEDQSNETAPSKAWAQVSSHSNPGLLEVEGCWLDHGSASGVVLRDDVRTAAVKMWAVACARTRTEIGDTSETPALMEAAVVRTSQYLDGLSQEASTGRAYAVLITIFTRLLRKQARRQGRLHAVGRDIESVARVPSWEREVHVAICLEQLERKLSQQGGAILRLRRNGYSWRHIARMFRTTVTAITKSFWREIGNAKIELKITPRRKPQERTNGGRWHQGLAA